ncbi:SRPBCC family protein [Nocardia sp. NPDC055029]|uniref:SRPBCC family protein n=1 Tax=Nocardia sp. NPDC060259 TaxID=3347088 RepID=UPI003668DC61
MTKEIAIAADSDAAWQILADFADGPVRMAPGFVLDSTMDGPDVRVVTFAGGTALRERLITLDHPGKRLVFSVVGDTTRPVHDNATIQVSARDNGHCTVTWTHDVLPAELATEWGPAMAHVLELFKKTLE